MLRLLQRLRQWIARHTTCKEGCGSKGFTLLRREELGMEMGSLFGEPILITKIDDRARCLACGTVHRFPSRMFRTIQ